MPVVVRTKMQDMVVVDPEDDSVLILTEVTVPMGKSVNSNTDVHFAINLVMDPFAAGRHWEKTRIQPRRMVVTKTDGSVMKKIKQSKYQVVNSRRVVRDY